jgi:hypothetical protein
LLNIERGVRARCLPPAVVHLIEIASAVNAFEPDWNRHERWLFMRLLETQGCRQAVFELAARSTSKAWGTTSNTYPPKHRRVQIYAFTTLAVTCSPSAQMDPNAGHKVPSPAAEEIARQLMRHMDKTGQNRLVHVRCAKRLEARDTDAIVRETKAAIDAH